MIKDNLPEKLRFQESLPAVEELMNRSLLQSDEIISDVMGHLVVKGGKNLRSKLFLCCAQDAECCVKKNAVTAAAAIEILHLATLVHDDVIDDSKIRRGQASLQSRYGKKAAVICGDYLFCKCFTMVSEMSAQYPEKFKDFSGAMTKICLGEFRQFKHNADYNLSIFGYLRIIAGKTAALFSLSMYAGTIVGGGGEKEARLMARIGFDIGMLFQILDDCMDYNADYQRAKKSVKHDLAEGIVTLPLIYSLRRDPQLKQRVEGYFLGVAQVGEIIAEVVDAGGVSMSMKVADKYYEKAKKRINGVEDLNKRIILNEVLEKLKGN